MIQHIQFAALAFVAKWLKHPRQRFLEAPCNRIPTAVRVGVPQMEIVCVDLEFGSGYNPVWGMVGRIHGIDFGRMRRITEINIHRNDAVAIHLVLVGPLIGARHCVNMVLGIIRVWSGICMSLGVPKVTITVFFIRNGELIRLVVGDGQVENVCAVAFHISKVVMVCLGNPILAFIVGLTRDRPIVSIAGLFRFRMVKLLMEPEVQSMLDGTASVWVVKNDFVVCVFMIADSRLVPIPTWRRPMCITFILVEHGWHLELVNREYQLLHFQAAVVVDGVEIGDLSVLVIERSMEVVYISNTDAGVNK